VSAQDLWTLSETRKHCLTTISEEYRGGLDDCKAYCEKNGATRLAFSSNNYCRCCTASSKLSFHVTSQMHTLEGKYIYAPTTNYFFFARVIKLKQEPILVDYKTKSCTFKLRVYLQHHLHRHLKKQVHIRYYQLI